MSFPTQTILWVCDSVSSVFKWIYYLSATIENKKNRSCVKSDKINLVWPTLSERGQYLKLQRKMENDKQNSAFRKAEFEELKKKKKTLVKSVRNGSNSLWSIPNISLS